MRSISDFIGVFDIIRVIDDRKSMSQTRFEGQATVSATPHGAEFHEAGVLVLNGQRFTAERRYIWHEDAARICVSFQDGRTFHDFDPTKGGQATEHLCGEDMYRGGYDFSDWPRWRLVWDVTGPRKDYRSVTQFQPAGETA